MDKFDYELMKIKGLEETFDGIDESRVDVSMSNSFSTLGRSNMMSIRNIFDFKLAEKVSQEFDISKEQQKKLEQILRILK